MIYEDVPKDRPIQQGDIFYPLPLHTIELSDIRPVGDSGPAGAASWLETQREGAEVVGCVAMKPTWAIVATQHCEALRARYISFFAIDAFKAVTGLTLPEEHKADKWIRLLIQKSRLTARWFYLPGDAGLGFEKRMAVDFRVQLFFQRRELEGELASIRRGRLCREAYEHYRERVAYYFRRYPYDEWYPFTKHEFAEYNKDRPGASPRPWQR